jgi:uncharacterized protein YndB with AHSA1/START domain
MKAQLATESLHLRRTYDASRERVFRAWTERAELEQWYTPADGHVLEILELDVRPGGTARFAFGFPGEEPYVETNVYREIVPPERLAFTMTLSHGGEVMSTTEVLVELFDRGGRTEVVITDRGPGAREHEQGWGPTLDHLEQLLTSGRS